MNQKNWGAYLMFCLYGVLLWSYIWIFITMIPKESDETTKTTF